MLNAINHIASLNRPKLLIRAARAGMTTYNRDNLKQVIGDVHRLSGKDILTRLVEREEQLDTQRRNRDISYDVRRHIMILTGIIAEASAYQAQSELEYKMAA